MSEFAHDPSNSAVSLPPAEHARSTPKATKKGEGPSYAAAYQEVCNTYHAIDTFRAQLLGLLPLVSGIGILALVKELAAAGDALVFAGVFGGLITIGLFLYEVRGIRHCTFLIDRGRTLETRLGVAAEEKGQFAQALGQFAHWDADNPRKPGGVADFPGAARVIYPSVFAAWVFVASYPLGHVKSDILPSSVWQALPILVGIVAWALAFAVAYDMTGEAVKRPSEPLETTCVPTNRYQRAIGELRSVVYGRRPPERLPSESPEAAPQRG